MMLSDPISVERWYRLLGVVLGVGLLVGMSAAPALADGNVRVQVTAEGDLLVTGDVAANAITITTGAVDDQFVVTGLNDTKVNGTNAVTVDGVDRDVRTDMRGGNDVVTISDVTVPRDLRVLTGSGSDGVTLSDLVVSEDLEVRTDTGADQVTLDVVTVEREARIETEGGTDTVNITDSVFTEKMEVRLGDAGDVLTVAGSKFLDETRFEGGVGTDRYVDAGGNSFEPGNPELREIERR